MKLSKNEINKLKATDKIQLESKLNKAIDEKNKIKKEKDVALKEINRLNKEKDVILEIKDYVPKPFNIEVKKSSHTSEATANLLMSDWHCEEKVEPETVNNLNEYNPTIAKNRAVNFFKGGLRLIEIQRNGVEINNCVLAILGDMISGNIHDELRENNYMSATQAILYMQEILISGIDFLLKNGGFKKISIICMFGNHSRITKEVRFATSYKENFEYLMFHQIKKHYEKEKRLEIIVPNSMIFYFSEYDFKIRFLHGSNIIYHGGVGTLTIPASKAIAQWDKSEQAYITIFGHFHTLFDGNSFICNSSGIGYNAYAMNNKFSFELPQQFMFLMDSKRGKTISAKIFLD